MSSRPPNTGAAPQQTAKAEEAPCYVCGDPVALVPSHFVEIRGVQPRDPDHPELMRPRTEPAHLRCAATLAGALIDSVVVYGGLSGPPPPPPPSRRRPSRRPGPRLG